MKLFEPDALWKIRTQFLWFVLWAGVTSVGIYLHPSSHGHGTHQQLGLPPCPSVLMFNRPCPGCGLTTSWTALIHGEFITSFRAHPLGIPMYLGFTSIALGTLIGNIRKQKLRIDTEKANLFFIWAIVAFFIFGLARMALVSDFASTPKEMIYRQALSPTQSQTPN